jgi:hypothetical protein
MPDPSFALRQSSSGPVVTGTPGDVLTFDPGGQTVSGKPPGKLTTIDVVASGPATVCDFTRARSVHVEMEVNTTLSIVWPPVDMVVIVRLIQGAGGGFVASFPAEVKFTDNAPPTWSTTPGHWDQIAIDWDGVTGTASYGLNYGP